ncbi:MAG: hypothetical protein LRY73_14340 [Bacillus sp. (in: Bacteria)]|nr:hypothetical protein [Bacillus sp. (in: firmicutes)]
MRKQHDFHDLDDRLRSLDVDSSWNEEQRQQLKTRILRDAGKNKPETSHLGRFPYKYYFSLGAAVLILWILVAPSLQVLFPEWNLVTSGDGPEEAGGMLQNILMFLVISLFLIGAVFFIRNNERANKLFWDTNGFGLLSDIMRELVSKFFNLLVILLGIYLLVNNILLFVSLIVVFLVRRRYKNRMVILNNYAYPFQVLGSLLIILFFAFKLYTPYFFTEEYLIQSGLEKIDIYYEATRDNDLTLEERIELAKTPYGSRAEFLFSRRLYMEDQGEDIILRDYTLIDLVDFNRRFHEYSLVVEVEVQWYEDGPHIERELRRYTFEREEGDFKIIGGGRLSEYQKSLLDLD